LIFLDGMRMPIKRHTAHFKEHFAVLENEDWYCGICDKTIPGNDNNLIYFGEQDLVNHNHNPPITSINFKISIKEGVRCCGFIGGMPKQIDKLIKNTYIKTDSNTNEIKLRDGYKCQICGFDDSRALEVHHIVPRSSPFIVKSFIRSPLNCITLCANCHRIAQSILRDGYDKEREESVKQMGKLNGWNMKWFDSMYYESHHVFGDYKD